MTTYKQGQTGKIMFTDGSYAVGIIKTSSVSCNGFRIVVDGQSFYFDRGNVEILAEPPVAEPTRVGAVVRAHHMSASQRYDFTLASDGMWYREKNGTWLSTRWASMNDPEILWEGPEEWN